MRILLRKIRATRQPFRLEEEGAVCEGEFWREDRHRVVLEGRIEGPVALRCDRCGEAFTKEIDESFRLEAVDRPLKVDESLDVIECNDGIVDFNEICRSEIASIQSEYHICPGCEAEGDFEIEY
ncbi:YceD family protein [Hydrogenimonas sp.]